MLRLSKVCFFFLVLGALDNCRADEDDMEQAGDSDNEGDSMIPDEEMYQEDAEEWTGADEPEDDQATHGLTVEQMQALHKIIDKNSDGKVSMEEAKKFAFNIQEETARWETPEQVKDWPSAVEGKYTSQEILRGPWNGEEPEGLDPDEEEHHDVKFKAADENNDGLLDKEELPVYFYPEIRDHSLTAAAAYQLKWLDLDNDTQLTVQELVNTDDAEVGADALEDFKSLDRDGNGFLNVEEFKAYHSGWHWTEKDLKSLFVAADDDDDKHITASEFQDAHDTMDNQAFYFLGWWAQHHEL